MHFVDCMYVENIFLNSLMVMVYCLKGSRGVTSAVLDLSFRKVNICVNILHVSDLWCCLFCFFPAYLLFGLVFPFLQSLFLNVTQEYLTVDVKTVMYKSKILQYYINW